MIIFAILGIIAAAILGILDGRSTTSNTLTWTFIKAQRRALAARTRASKHIVDLERTREKEQINHALGEVSNAERYDDAQKELKRLIDQFDGYDFSRHEPQIQFSPSQMRRYYQQEMQVQGRRIYPVRSFGKKPCTSIVNETTWLDDISSSIESTCYTNLVWRGLRPTLVGEE